MNCFIQVSCFKLKRGLRAACYFVQKHALQQKLLCPVKWSDLKKKLYWKKEDFLQGTSDFNFQNFYF